MSSTVELRRVFWDGRFGQMHVRVARPAPGNPVLFPPLVCLHQSPKSGKQMEALIKTLGRDRVCYAPDFPGFGDSAPPPRPPTVADYAAAIGDLLDAWGHVPVDFYGYHTGALSAVELAIARPTQVRRLVLVGLPLLDDAERQAIRSQPWPVPITTDGSHLVTEWKRALHWAGPGQTLAMTAEGFVDKLKAGEKAFWGALAATAQPFHERLPLVSQPILAIGPRDDLWDISPRGEALMRNGRFERWPDYGFGVMDVATDVVAAAVRRHLDPA
ncbi:MAG: alpha/beta fold hydrolase [Rhodospirillaceae bacterium]|nr:alpha/beta fold hydrolase [Rhodospirillaceae bacterium]